MSMIVSGVGRLTRDPELRDAGGTPATTIRVAWDTRQKIDSEWQAVPGFINVSVFGRQAETVCEHLGRGRQVFVSGRLEPRSWTDRDGNERHEFEVRASDVTFVGSKGDGATNEQGGAPRAQADDEPDW